MDETMPWEEPYECPHCGHVAPYNEFESSSDLGQAVGALECPACDACIFYED